jgi:hypothetical protein
MARLTTSRGRQTQPLPRHRLNVERLEYRALPSSTLYVDFGDNFPVGGFDLTDLQLRSDFSAGGLQGPNLSFSDATLYRFLPASQRVTFDYNGSGTVNAQDWIDLRTTAMSLVQRYYAPFDVNVVLAPAIDNTNSATYFAGVQATLQAGPAVTGERDCWCFSIYGTVASSGAPISPGTLYGVASGRDIGGNNANDDACVAFADAILAAYPNANADTALGYTSAHEPAHCFGLAHTSNASQLSNSDVIVGSAGGTNRTNLDFFTRYPLTLDGGGVANNHDRYANPNVLGLRAGAPVLVTGTGEHDIITITRLTDTTANVTVQAFSNATYTTPITVPGSSPSTTTYAYTLTFNATDGILVEGGFDNDRIIIDATLGVPITVRGLAGTDQLIVHGNGAAAGTYTPNGAVSVGVDGVTSYGGQIAIGATTISFSELETASTIEVDGVTTFTVVTPNSSDAVTVDTVTGGRFRVAGTSGAVAMVPLIGDVTNLTVDLATNDGATANDAATVILAGVVATGRQVTLSTGAGIDTIGVQSLAASTTLNILAGIGNDSISVDSNGATAGGTVDNIRGLITIDGQGGTDALTLEDSSDTTADTVTADGSRVGATSDTFFGAGGAITYVQLASIRLGLAAAATGDTATVTPTGSVVFFVDGNSPIAGPNGDRLSLVLDGVTNPLRTPSTPSDGAWTFANRQPVNYTGIEDQFVIATPDVIIGDGTVQRSRIAQLRVVFDHLVTFAGTSAAAFTLDKMSDGLPIGSVGFNVSTATVNGVTEATITFTSDTTFGSLNDGRYRLTVLANQISVAGVSLASDTVTNFHRMYGDINGSANVDIADFGMFSTTFNLHSTDSGFNAAFDYNNDGVIDIADFGQFSVRIFTTLGP